MSSFVITGARTGLGLANVAQLALAKENIIFALVRSLNGDLSALREIQAAGPATVHIIECDTSSGDSIAGLTDRIKAVSPSVVIDVVINNAAVLHDRQTSLTLTAESLSSHMATNVLGPARVTAVLLPLLAPVAKVVNITSGLGSLALLSDGSIPVEATPYSLSKTALNMLTVHQAKEVRKGIIVICVDPGHCKTEMGGPNAVTEPDESAKGVQSIISRLREEDSGKFFLYTGEELPW